MRIYALNLTQSAFVCVFKSLFILAVGTNANAIQVNRVYILYFILAIFRVFFFNFSAVF